MVTIYDSKETNFEHNGLGILSPTLCDTTQELNGMYELELQHPFFDKAGMWQNIVEGNIIKVEGQLFRIYHKKKSSIGGITVNARHVFYDLLDNFLEDVRPSGLNGAAALDWILSHTQYAHSFVSTSDISTVNTAYYIKKNPVQAILGEGGIIACWGGELVRDNFTINLKQAMGADRGVTIRYGKNLKEIEDDSNWDDVITRIYPTGKDGLTLPEKYIDSPLINNYPNPKIRAVEFSTAETEDDLRAQAQAYMNSGVDKPVPNYKIDFQDLSKTEEYKNYAVLETVYLGDTVTIKNTRYNFDLKAKMIKYKYDHLAKKYKEIQLGNFKKNFANNLVSTLRQMSDVIVSNKSDLQKAIDDATALLNSALGGYVLKRKGEILIMDTEDPMTATKVWRWNLNGLGYSSQGINGDFPIAMTMDGKINASFITTGSLNASIIKTGIIQSQNGMTQLNLDTGEFLLKNANNQTLISAAGIMQSDTIQIVDNVDLTHNLKLKFYIDDDMVSIKKAKLSFSLEKFRAYEKGMAAGGGASYTTNSGGADYISTDTAYLSGTTDNAYTYGGVGEAHSHSFSYNHSHQFNTPNHTHTVLLNDHTHNLQYGIFEDTVASGVKVYVDGTLRMDNGGNGYTSDQNLDVSQWITTKGWHTVELSSSQLGRINASLFLKSYISA